MRYIGRDEPAAVTSQAAEALKSRKYAAQTLRAVVTRARELTTLAEREHD